MAMQATTASVTRVILQAKITDKLKPHPDGLHVSELADKVGMHPGKLGRIMRVLTSKHIFWEGAHLIYHTLYRF